MDKQSLYSSVDNGLCAWLALHGRHPLQSLIHSANRYAFDESPPVVDWAPYLRLMFLRLGEILTTSPDMLFPKAPPVWAGNAATILSKMPPNPTIDQLLKTLLPIMGYSGLADGDGCGCSLDDVAPCRENCAGCRAGYLQAPSASVDLDEFTTVVFLNKTKAVHAATNQEDYAL